MKLEYIKFYVTEHENNLYSIDKYILPNGKEVHRTNECEIDYEPLSHFEKHYAFMIYSDKKIKYGFIHNVSEEKDHFLFTGEVIE
jgi:hypothetical protein